MIKVLVAYASKHHSTAEIAASIAQTLKQFKTLDVTIQAIEKVEYITGYDAVVLGSAVYAGNWRPAAAEFLQFHAQELEKIPVWLFSSGPTGVGDPKNLLQGWEFPAALRVTAFHIQPRDIAAFHGEINVSKLNSQEKTVINKEHRPVGDFRQWDAIQQWAAKIGLALTTESDHINLSS